MSKRDILSQLKDPNNFFYNDDYDLIINELELGDYDDEYIFECKELINSLRTKNEEIEIFVPDDLIANPSEVLPLKNRASSNSRTINDQILYEIYHLREFGDYKKRFINYVKATPEIDEIFVETNISKFNSSELNDILMNRNFSENFLEKYFDVLPISGICKNQIFSDDFYIRHYDKLNIDDILKNKNLNWKNKSNRSDKLETFLRLKGII